MGGPRGVIRPGVNFAVRDSPDRASPPPGDVVPARLTSRKRVRDDGDSEAAAGETRKKKGKKDKKERQKRLMKHLSLRAEATTPVLSRDHPFEVDAADHCETPFAAYQDIEPFLFRVALALRKPKEKLRIYDPYFCEGSVAKHLARLGFTCVYNENEDFYAVVRQGRVPEHDVLLTNPPYSGDHFRKILEFCGRSRKPWLLLLPNFVCRKAYYQPSLGLEPGAGDATGACQKTNGGGGDAPAREAATEKPLFLIPDPARPYRYWAPGRAGHETRAKGTTPFETFWYVHFGGLCAHADVRAWWLKKFQPHSTCALPDADEALPQQQRLQKRANPRARATAAEKKKGARRDGSVGEDARRARASDAAHRATAGVYYDPEKARRAAETRRLAERRAVEEGGAGKQKRRRTEKKPRERKARESSRAARNERV